MTPGLSRRHDSVASPGFVARRGKDGNYVMGHSRWTSGPGAAAAQWLDSFVTNAVLIERAVSCWHLHQLISQTTQYLDSWLSVYSKVNYNEIVESRGEHVPQYRIAGDATAGTVSSYLCDLIRDDIDSNEKHLRSVTTKGYHSANTNRTRRPCLFRCHTPSMEQSSTVTPAHRFWYLIPWTFENIAYLSRLRPLSVHPSVVRQLTPVPCAVISP